MPKIPTKPTIESVFNKMAAAKSYWGIRVMEQNTDYLHFTLQQQINVPDGFNTITPPSGYSIVAAAADHIAGDEPQVQIPVANIKKSAELRSERLEKSVQAALRRFEQESATNPVRTLATNLLWAGMGVSQGPLFDPDAWGDEPVRGDYESESGYDEAKDFYDTQKKVKWPFYWRIIDPRYCFPDPGTNGREWVILNYQRTVGEIKTQWPKWSPKISVQENAPGTALSGMLGGGTGIGIYGTGGGSGTYLDTDVVEWVEYWDSKWRVYIAQNSVISITPHRYGKPPFQIRSAGLGNDSQLPHERFRSLLFPARSFLLQEIRAMCQLDAEMRKSAWTQMMTPIGSNFQSVMPGTVVRMRKEDIELTKAVTEYRPDVAQGLMQELEMIRSGLEDATYPSVVRGRQAKGIPSGYGQNSLVAQARVRFGPIAAAMESILSEFVSDFLRCVELVVEEPVPIWGPTTRGFVDQILKPEDIHGYYFNMVKINPKMPTDRASEVQIGAQLLQLQAIDLDTFIQDFAGYQQPEEMRTKIRGDQILASPEIQAFLKIATIHELGFLDWAKDISDKIGIPFESVIQSFGLGQPQGGTPTSPPGIRNVAPQGPTVSGANGSLYPTQQSEPMPGGPMDVASQAEVAQAAGTSQLRGPANA